MLAADDISARNVISLTDYRKRLRPWDDGPPGPPPLGGRKRSSDTLLAEFVLADSARELRFAS
jgi:hypothetical protein